MDKLQRWLKKKEVESPSPSLQENPATLKERLKTLANALSRRVKYIPQKTHNSLTDYEIEIQERSKENYEQYLPSIGNKPVTTELSFLNARKRIVESLRNPEITWYLGRQDNLDNSLAALSNLWKYSGWEDNKLPKVLCCMIPNLQHSSL